MNERQTRMVNMLCDGFEGTSKIGLQSICRIFVAIFNKITIFALLTIILSERINRYIQDEKNIDVDVWSCNYDDSM